ncbi:hypothetical protein [Suid alphaherpesvirus 1]|nr:hypothetical protein [Suid alphaherpesvirus 1]
MGRIEARTRLGGVWGESGGSLGEFQLGAIAASRKVRLQ